MRVNITGLRLGAGAIVVAALVVVAAPAYAGDWYAEVRGGASLIGNASETGVVDIINDYGTGYNISGAVGYSFAGNIRVDLEFAHRRAGNSGNFTENVQTLVCPAASFPGNPCLDPATRGRISAQAVMANVYYDFMMDGRFRPYLGAGLGLARVHMKVTTTATESDGGVENFNMINGGKTSFAWQVAAGTGFILSEGLLFTLGVRHFQGGSPSFAGQGAFTTFVLKDTFKSSSLEAGLRLRF